MKWVIKLGTLIALGSNLVVSKRYAYPFHFPKVIVFYIGVWIMMVWYLPLLLIKRPHNIAPILTYVGSAFISSFKAGNRSLWSDIHRMDGWVSMAHHAAFALAARELPVKWLMKMNVIIGALFSSWELLYKTVCNNDFLEKKPMDNPLYSSPYLLFVCFPAIELTKEDKRWGYLLMPCVMSLIKHRRISSTAGFIVGMIGFFSLLGVPILPWLLKRKKFVSRLEGWKTGYRGLKEKPLWGWGVDMFYKSFEKYADEDFYNTGAKWFDKAHNKYVSILTEQGVAGAVSFGWLTMNTYRNLEQKWLRRGLIAYLVNSITSIDSNLSHVQYWLFVACSRKSKHK